MSQVERLFHELSELPAEAQAERLRQIEDRSIREEVRSLLEHARQAGSFLEPPTAAEAPSRRDDRDNLRGGIGIRRDEQIGRYIVRQELGEGGFGVVYLAEQREPVRRMVAVKVIKPGMDTRDVLQRFDMERQTLALMDHPNVARVFDAGSTPEGRPYFVMEYVPGVPITHFAESQRLSIRGRLELFVSVCEAVQHAHQKGIIHRDLKPSNILVMLVDGRPVAKVIDFGIAKATDQHALDRSHFTRHGDFFGTVEYMSPEQAENSPLGIDTRADVYSLGVVLYQLLTGHLPFDPQTLRTAALDEVRRILREVPPPKPSTRVMATAAGRSGTVTRSLRGDIDWIVLKAMDKDRARRYDSAASLAADITHYLRAEPVSAGPPSATYRMRKFVQRHRVGVGVGGLMASVLVLGCVGIAWQWVRAEHALRDAESRYAQILGLSGSFLDELDRSLSRVPGATAAREASTHAGIALLEELEATSEPSPELSWALLEAYVRLSRILIAAEVPAAERVQLFRRALDATSAAHLGTDAAQAYRIELEAGLGAAILQSEGVSRAGPIIAESLRRAESLESIASGQPAIAHALALAYAAAADLAAREVAGQDAARYFDRAVRFQRAAVASRGDPSDLAELADLLIRAAAFHITDGSLERARELCTDALAVVRSWRGPGRAPIELTRAEAKALDTRGYAQDSAGLVDAALIDYAEAVEAAERIWRDDQLDASALGLMVRAYDNHADLLYRQGRFEDAEALYRVFSDHANQALAADPLRTDRRYAAALAQEKLGDALDKSGEFAAAAERYATAREVYEDLAQQNTDDRKMLFALARTTHHRGLAMYKLGDRTASLRLYEASRSSYEQLERPGDMQPPEHMDFSLLLRHLGYSLIAAGRYEEAIQPLQQSYERSWLEDPKRHKVLAALAHCQNAMGDIDAARHTAERALRELSQISTPDAEDQALLTRLMELAKTSEGPAGP